MTAPAIPPHSVEAEQGVLGALLLDNRAWERMGDALQPADFYRAEHRTIYAAIARLIGNSKPADPITVLDDLQAHDQADAAGGMAYLTALLDAVAGIGSVKAYAGIVRQRARRRRLMALARDVIEQAGDMTDEDAQIGSTIDRTMLALMGLQAGAGDDEPRRVDDLLPGWLEALEDRANGKTDAIGTGLHDLDTALAGGMRRGELVVIGARPSMGKSALMLTITRAVAGRGPVLACSLEDSDQMLLSRLVAGAGRVNLADLRMPAGAGERMWTATADAVDQLRPLALYLDDKAGIGLADVRRKALNVKRRAGDLLLVVVDYLQLMDGEGESRAFELAQIARGLKRLAKELQCAVLLLSQLSREADKTDAPPRLDHLAESGGIEQAADIIGLLWREARRKPKPDNKHRAQIELAKNKNGATATVQLFFDGATQRFADAEVAHA